MVLAGVEHPDYEAVFALEGLAVAIVGSREYADLDAVRTYVRDLVCYVGARLIISGGARGVDRVAVATAKQHGGMTKVYPADWQRHGKRAGFIRNQQIVHNADKVVAFWDGKSNGTHHTIKLADDANKLHEVIRR